MPEVEDGFVRIIDEDGSSEVAYLEEYFLHAGEVLVVVIQTENDQPRIDDVGVDRDYLAVDSEGNVKKCVGVHVRWAPVSVDPMSDETRVQWLAIIGDRPC